jgi:hypothetical protein
MGEKPMFWSECLELAVAFGWRPAGILYPMTGLEVFEDKPEEFAKEGGANGSGMERTLETPSSLAAFFVSQRKREGARRRGEICSRRLNDRMKLTVVRGEAVTTTPKKLGGIFASAAALLRPVLQCKNLRFHRGL